MKNIMDITIANDIQEEKASMDITDIKNISVNKAIMDNLHGHNGHLNF
jgi:hypothetical protein